jgi:Fe-S-cluster-containing hydrogenase component 2
LAPFWRCWFDTIAVSGDDSVIVDEEKCLGCEQCAVSCPEEAIQMTEVRDPAFIPGCFSEIVSSFSVTCQKTKQKNTPVSRIILRVAKPSADAAHRLVYAAGARGNSPAY